MAVQPRQQIHRALPRDARNHELRFGLRRQRSARQKMFRFAHRFGDGSRRRLARRTHVDFETHEPKWRIQIHRRCVSVGVRQNKFGDARADDQGLESRDNRRRHLLDEVRQRRSALCDQPRGRLFRRRTRHGLRHERQRNAHAERQLHFHQHGPDIRRRRVVGRHDRYETCTRHRLAQQHLDTRERDSGGAPERKVHRAGKSMSIDCPRMARPKWRANLGDFVRRSSTHNRATRDASIRLGPRSFSRLDHGQRNNCGCWRRCRQTSLRPNGNVAVLWLQHGRLFRALVVARRKIFCGETSANIFRQLV